MFRQKIYFKVNDYIKKIESNIQVVRNQLVHHEVYSAIKSLEDVQVFMQYHVFAVWDFMSLLKSLQIELTCTSIPWFPNGNPETRFLINEIVVGEESDKDENGNIKSHYEMYLEAMHQCGAPTKNISNFISTLKETRNLEVAFSKTNLPESIIDFVRFTFEIIHSKKTYLQAAIFTFGREDLIPDMFHSIVTDINKKFPNKISKFKYYLDRHIEVDGGHHGHLAIQMLQNLCGNDKEKWDEAEKSIVQALNMRSKLWDGVLKEISEVAV